MSQYQLKNKTLSVHIAAKGAELQSIFNHETNLEYLWNGDSAFWPKQSPVLFPIVGGLKNNSYFYKGTEYQLGKHGFARERDFSVVAASNSSIKFCLSSDAETLKIYPFEFAFYIEYTILENQLSCKYIVENTGNEELFFSVGAHPAFKVPLTDNTTFNDWYLEFNQPENADIYLLNTSALLETKSTPFFANTDVLPLKKELFYKDALVFKSLQSDSISLKSKQSKHGLTMHFTQLPFFGIWSAVNADFVCLEPWCGIADSANTNQELTTKEGICRLSKDDTFERTWSIDLF